MSLAPTWHCVCCQNHNSFWYKNVGNGQVGTAASRSDSQRQATKDACTVAGFNVLRTINEATAAVIAHGLDKEVEAEKNVPIFDLGGSTFDVSLLAVSSRSNPHTPTWVVRTSFDSRLVNHFGAAFRRKHKKYLTANSRAMCRSEPLTSAPSALSSAAGAQTSIEIDSLHESMGFFTSITRARFEELCGDLFRSTLDPSRRSSGIRRSTSLKCTKLCS